MESEDDRGIAKYLPAIYEELKGLDKEELIKRMVSIEFNRFLEYYRTSYDLNIDYSKKDHVRSEDTYRSIIDGILYGVTPSAKVFAWILCICSSMVALVSASSGPGYS